MKILGIAGSLRKGSFNKALLKEAVKLVPAGMKLEIYDIKDIPFYNQDLADTNFPTAAKELKAAISESDGILIATPEYNYSLPAVLKNAIDWASRPADNSPLNKKPFAVMGASTGLGGTIRAQLHLRQVALFVNMYDMKKPEVLVTRAQEKFDEELNITDEPLKAHLTKFLLAFRDWVNIFMNEQKAQVKATGQN